MEHDSEKINMDLTNSRDPVQRKADAVAITESEFSPEEQKKIISRIDRRLITTVGFMYCVSLMDRTNLGAAILADMGKDLMLIGNRYSVVTLVFFVTYIVFQPPSTIIIRKIGPRIHLSLITLFWGAVMIGMGFVKNWQALAACRIILGILEAGFFPSCVYLLSTWYTRFGTSELPSTNVVCRVDEVGKKYSLFYLLGCVASAFAGILAFGLMHMRGLANLNGWRWIFIIEGLVTCLLGIAGYWLLVDFPDSKRASWRFLNERERAWVVASVNADRGDAKPQPFSLAKFLRAGLDLKIWAYGLIFFNTTTITYALAFFMPIILRDNMKFDAGTSQCLVAPPYVLAGIVMYATAWAGDRYRVRGPVILFNMLLCIIGLPIVGYHTNPGVRYFGVFLVTAGANSNVPAAMSYQANNIRGQWKRAFCSATLVGLGGVGGIAGSLVFRSQDNPKYLPGLWACIACALFNIVLVCIMTIVIHIENGKADRGEKELEGSDDDYHPGFRYTY
ncbi:uncharacterized protein E0L32_002744 [Thyridium curvatum]|uniref:Major facilitator superfamily (MFS) profile domain-containing protein n=1 Tax=Thyridium curvatum TaxID=1093900 RepID=A0A507B534_9PEZI|nr:uncharacterized protein E0L32_002744 [Thyridium curvatum]TPX18235.1 hypothetical protein E0L32_002744 [Thyridium curvatum]